MEKSVRSIVKGGLSVTEYVFNFLMEDENQVANAITSSLCVHSYKNDHDKEKATLEYILFYVLTYEFGIVRRVLILTNENRFDLWEDSLRDLLVDPSSIMLTRNHIEKTNNILFVLNDHVSGIKKDEWDIVIVDRQEGISKEFGDEIAEIDARVKIFCLDIPHLKTQKEGMITCLKIMGHGTYDPDVWSLEEIRDTMFNQGDSFVYTSGIPPCDNETDFFSFSSFFEDHGDACVDDADGESSISIDFENKVNVDYTPYSRRKLPTLSDDEDPSKIKDFYSIKYWDSDMVLREDIIDKNARRISILLVGSEYLRRYVNSTHKYNEYLTYTKYSGFYDMKLKIIRSLMKPKDRLIEYEDDTKIAPSKIKSDMLKADTAYVANPKLLSNVNINGVKKIVMVVYVNLKELKRAHVVIGNGRSVNINLTHKQLNCANVEEIINTIDGPLRSSTKTEVLSLSSNVVNMVRRIVTTKVDLGGPSALVGNLRIKAEEFDTLNVLWKMRDKIMLIVAASNASTIIVKEKEPESKKKLIPTSLKPFDVATFVDVTKVHIGILRHIDIMYRASIRSAIASRMFYVQKFKDVNMRKEWLYFAGIHSICNRSDKEISDEIDVSGVPQDYIESYITLSAIARCVQKKSCAVFILKNKEAAVMTYRFVDGRIAIIGAYGETVERLIYNMFLSAKNNTDQISFISYAPIELSQAITNAAYRVGYLVDMLDLPAKNPLACISYYASFAFNKKPSQISN